LSTEEAIRALQEPLAISSLLEQLFKGCNGVLSAHAIYVNPSSFFCPSQYDFAFCDEAALFLEPSSELIWWNVEQFVRLLYSNSNGLRRATSAAGATMMWAIPRR
jgi:hypothetical protein